MFILQIHLNSILKGGVEKVLEGKGNRNVCMASFQFPCHAYNNLLF